MCIPISIPVFLLRLLLFLLLPPLMKQQTACERVRGRQGRRGLLHGEPTPRVRARSLLVRGRQRRRETPPPCGCESFSCVLVGGHRARREARAAGETVRAAATGVYRGGGGVGGTGGAAVQADGRRGGRSTDHVAQEPGVVEGLAVPAREESRVGSRGWVFSVRRLAGSWWGGGNVCLACCLPCVCSRAPRGRGGVGGLIPPMIEYHRCTKSAWLGVFLSLVVCLVCSIVLWCFLCV